MVASVRVVACKNVITGIPMVSVEVVRLGIATMEVPLLYPQYIVLLKRDS